jgi:hypothetical protein
MNLIILKMCKRKGFYREEALKLGYLIHLDNNEKFLPNVESLKSKAS